MKLGVLSTLCAFALILGMFTSADSAPVSGQGTWETTLQARDFDGDPSTIEGWFDILLNITWLADAGYVQTSGRNISPNLTWNDAVDWAAALTMNGVKGWRFLYVNPVDGVNENISRSYDGTTDVGYNISAPGTMYEGSTASEMAHLFYHTLGNLGYYDTLGNSPQSGWGLTNTGPFINISARTSGGEPLDYYWSASGRGYPLTCCAYIFSFVDGEQTVDDKGIPYAVWLVHDGDVGTPIATTVSADIDVKAGADSQCPSALAVAVFGSDTLDVAQIDQSTLSFEGLEVSERRNGALKCRINDVNDDGYLDLLCQYQDSTTDGILKGQLLDGTPIEGSDTICVLRN